MADERNGKVDEFKVTTLFGTLAAKGIRISDILVIILTILLTLLLYILWQHMKDAHADSMAMSKAIIDQTTMQQRAVIAQSLTSCILAVDGNKRDEEFTNPNSFCHRITGG